jgi:putative transposase
MRGAGLRGVSRRRFPATTQREPNHRPASDLIGRDFRAGGPGRLWVADITSVPTAAGFLFLAVVLDAPSRSPLEAGTSERQDRARCVMCDC